MRNQRSLPAIFWILIALAGVIAVILVVAIVLESLPQARRDTLGALVAVPSAVEDVMPTAAPENLFCRTIHAGLELVPGAYGEKLAFVRNEGANLEVFTTLLPEGTIKRLKVLFDGRFTPRLMGSFEKTSICALNDAATCRSKKDLEVWQGITGIGFLKTEKMPEAGFIEFERKGKSEFALFRYIKGRPVLYSRLAVCGRPLRGDAGLHVMNSEFGEILVAYEPTRRILAFFSLAEPRVFTMAAAPLEPVAMYSLSAGYLIQVNCRDQNIGDKILNLEARDDFLLLVSRPEGSFGSASTIVRLTKNGPKVEEIPVHISKNINRGDAFRWLPGGHFMVSKDGYFWGKGKVEVFEYFANKVIPIFVIDQIGLHQLKANYPYGVQRKKDAQLEYMVVELKERFTTNPRMWFGFQAPDGGVRPIAVDDVSTWADFSESAEIDWIRLPSRRELIVWQNYPGGPIRASVLACGGR